MGCGFSKFMHLCWFRPCRGGDENKRLLDTKSDELKPVFFMVWRRNVLLQLDPDHHYAVDPWYFGLDPQIRTSDSRIWIYIRIRLRIRDILVRIRRSEPLAQGSGSILGSGSGSMIFWSGSADPNHWLKIWRSC